MLFQQGFILRLLALLLVLLSMSQGFADECSDGIGIPNPVPAGRVVLTFDDGPDPDHTPKILDTLKKHNIKATFFVIGAKAKKYPEIVKRMIAEGHLVGNHSLTHQDFSRVTDEVAYKQILLSRKTIGDVTEQSVPLFRFPEGKASCFGKKLLSNNHMQYLGWDIDSCDWVFSDGVVTDDEAQACEFNKSDRRNMVQTTLKRTMEKDGGVILLHDIHENTARDLDSLIVGLKKQSLRFSFAPDQSITATAVNTSRANTRKSLRTAN